LNYLPPHRSPIRRYSTVLAVCRLGHDEISLLSRKSNQRDSPSMEPKYFSPLGIHRNLDISWPRNFELSGVIRVTLEVSGYSSLSSTLRPSAEQGTGHIYC
jgi:hypothetical protein